MAKDMLINVSEGEECRIALLEKGQLDELYMERTSSTSHVGNIYKGRVTNVEPSIQAAFIDFGLGRNGFLHISDLMPTYFGRRGEDVVESVGRKMARRDRPPIQRCLRRGDEIIVQIIKEGIGTKGPTLSTYLSIPGRILVLMPGMGKMGISKKIEDEVERKRLRQILDGLKPPKDCGFIIRTNGVGKTKAEIERDLKYLTRLWEQIEKKQASSKGPIELYTEGDLVTRTVRDVFTTDIDRIVVDNKDVAKRVKEVIKLSSPRTKNKVEIYEEPVPLFHKYKIEHAIEQIYSRHVPLPSGGSLVIDSTEAIVAIDVNSGKFRDHADAETTAFKTDLEAADEIPRQLRLRDLGGVIICDFIDLRYERHRREVEQRLHDNLKDDRAKTKMLRMSQFGIIEMTRQRMRPSLKRSIYFDCPHCKGAGLVKTPESMSLDVMRRLAIAAHDLRVVRVELAISPDVGMYLLNKKRAALARLEGETRKKIIVRQDPHLGLDEMKLDLFDMRDGLVVLEELGMGLLQPPHVTQLGTRAPQQGRGRFDQRRQKPHGRRHGPPQQPVSADRFDMEEAEEDLEPSEVNAFHDDEAPEHDEEAPATDRSEAELGERPEGEWDPQGGGRGRKRRRRRRRRGRGNGQGEGGPVLQSAVGSSSESGADTDERAMFEARDEVMDQEEGAEASETSDRSERSGEQPASEGEGQPRRRRRRRGGRRHKKRNAAAQAGAAEQPGEAGDRTGSIEMDDEEAPEVVAESNVELDDAPAELEPSEPASAMIDDDEQDPRELVNEALDEQEQQEEEETPASPEPVAEEPQPEPEEKPKRRRPRRPRKSAKTASAKATAAKTPAASKDAADKHLVREDLVEEAAEAELPDVVSPTPASRPRSYRDLDAIPDDYDE